MTKRADGGAAELTIQERLRVYAAAGGVHIGPKFMREIADALDVAHASERAADQLNVDSEDALRTAIALHKRSMIGHGISFAICISYITIMIWVFA